MIKINDLTKSYGKNKIIDGISLSIDKGETYCLLGKNGTGKTTLINIILDLVKPDSGSIFIIGMKHNHLNLSIKKKIGAVTENLSLIKEISGYEYLRFIGKIYGIPSDILNHRINNIFQYFFNEEPDIIKSIATYSTGMKKKIAFCAAIIHTPDILILDEPFSGLDPIVANQMVSFIKKYQNSERTIFISSHDLGYVEKVSTQIGVLNNHKLVFNSSLQDFTENGHYKIDLALLNILKSNGTESNDINWI
jgi:ABC-2 type transport system ATP-binding protein